LRSKTRVIGHCLEPAEENVGDRSAIEAAIGKTLRSSTDKTTGHAEGNVSERSLKKY
jgi:hypothetical protein